MLTWSCVQFLYSAARFDRLVRMTGPCWGASAYANSRAEEPFGALTTSLLPRVISDTMAVHELMTDAMNLEGVSMDARGVAVTGSFSRADWVCEAVGANMHSKK
jgi:hypothetical protein